MSDKTAARVELTPTQIAFLNRYVSKVPEPRPAPQSGGTAGRSIVELQKLRLAYVEGRKAAKAQIVLLEFEINKLFADEKDLAEISRLAARLHEGLDAFDDELIDVLDAALNTQEPAERVDRENEAAKHIRRYLAAVENDPILKILDANPLRPVKVQAGMRNTLAVLAKRLDR